MAARQDTTPLVESRRATIADAALRVFARSGYHATPVAEVAKQSGFSQAYVFRLFDDKLTLFIAAIDRCFERVREAIEEGANRATGSGPEAMLEAMGHAYAELIGDRDLLMIQVHAQSASDIPQIRDAMRRGLAAVVTVVRERSRADGPAIQRFIAYGQLCHLIVTLDLDTVETDWARTVNDGMYHPPALNPVRP